MQLHLQLTLVARHAKAKLNEMHKLMGKYGVNPSHLAWIFGPSAYAQAQALDVVETLEKFGPKRNGSFWYARCLQRNFNHRFWWLREDLNASGVYDGTYYNE